uniref:recombinase family protein n=1 Tax=Paragemmobacter kunshanensis TaxID=2583234 RepID=UPI001F499FBD|nr:recombinase family protein [Rhodobacter kunshanensis]
MKHEKIGPQHLERKAILYVRQSSAHQVLHNRESSALQYAMRERLSDLGWSRIDTVDDDLGRSAAGGVAREGFDRMIADVCLGKVGAVAAREVSRFARNSRDWQLRSYRPAPQRRSASASSIAFRASSTVPRTISPR